MFFFVISGYLITSIINEECQQNSFSLLRFYQRRISRIIPVSFLVSLSTLFAASVIYNSQDYASAGSLATAAGLFVANLKLMLQGSYFEVSTDSQPFLHFWSLSVEEQFYLIFPFTFVHARKRLSRPSLLIGLGGLTLLSFLGLKQANILAN